MYFDRTLPKATLASVLTLLVVSCKDNPKEADAPQQETADSIQKENEQSVKALKPSGPAPDWGPTIKDEMAVVIDKLGTLGGKPIETLTAVEARHQPTPTDAVKAVMADNNMEMPLMTCDTIGKEIPVTGGKTRVRIYTPKGGAAPYPVIVYYHGGGFVIANIDTYNGGAQGLCENTKAIVVSVEYPKGPEKKFPAAHTTAFDAYKWVLKNAASFQGDPKKVAVAGESAGGNLAINVSMMARDKKIQAPLYQVLVYPLVNNDLNNESYTKYANAKPLNKAMIEWFVKQEFASVAQTNDPRVSVVKANLAGLPKTLIIGAEIDPLASEGKLLADKLKDAKVETDYKLYDGVTHEFFGMATVVPQAADAQKLASDKLKSAFGI